MSDNIKRAISSELKTDTIEMMEFTIGDRSFGINVAKVRDVMPKAKILPIVHSHPCIEGVIKLRQIVVTAINLPLFLTCEGAMEDKNLFIVTSFNKLNIAFRVDSIVGIVKHLWSDIKPAEPHGANAETVFATGIVSHEGRTITMLDFEAILAEISPKTTVQLDEIEKLGERIQSNKPILVAEDSMLLSKVIQEALRKAGYQNLIFFNNGYDAWKFLEEVRKKKNVLESVACVITDIEMPLMDGHTLVKSIKGDERLSVIPTIIFSSLINEELKKKGVRLGVSYQLSKPEIGELVEVIDRLTAKTSEPNKINV